MKTIIITGVAGFIGHAIAKKLLSKGYNVIGIDNMVGEGEILSIKKYRLSELLSITHFKLINHDIVGHSWKEQLSSVHCDLIIHLAAFAGVRKSMQLPIECLQTNILGLTSVLEFARSKGINRVIYASSSSVYGDISNTTKSSEETIMFAPSSIYAASKSANELVAHVYSQTYGIQTIGLRFFSVYGPYGRPDMAPWIFADSITQRKYVEIYGNGEMRRDFTYIDDVVEAISMILENEIPSNCEVYNIGSSCPYSVMRLFNEIQDSCGISGQYKLMNRKSGDVNYTYADMSKFNKDFGVLTHTNFTEGIKRFCHWFKKYKGLK